MKEILVVDAGDLLFKRYSGAIPEAEVKAATQKAHLMVEGFNLTGCDVFGIGDDDLNLGKEFLVEMSKKANFPFICSNLLDGESGKPLFETSLVKEFKGVRIGIFALLSPDLFQGPSDPRTKGLRFQKPVEVAQSMVKELQAKADLILLLSHLGYQADMALAQAVSGIHLMVGGHTGINLLFPPVVKNTVLLQSNPKGMYGAKFELTFFHGESLFYNIATKRTHESNLSRLNGLLMSKDASETQKAQYRAEKERIEKSLQKLQGQNEFANAMVPLDEKIHDHPDIAKLVDAYKSNFGEAPKPVIPK